MDVPGANRYETDLAWQSLILEVSRMATAALPGGEGAAADFGRFDR